MHAAFIIQELVIHMLLSLTSSRRQTNVQWLQVVFDGSKPGLSGPTNHPSGTRCRSTFAILTLCRLFVTNSRHFFTAAYTWRDIPTTAPLYLVPRQTPQRSTNMVLCYVMLSRKFIRKNSTILTNLKVARPTECHAARPFLDIIAARTLGRHWIEKRHGRWMICGKFYVSSVASTRWCYL